LLVFLSVRTCDFVNLACRIYLGRHLDSDDFGAIDPVFAFLAVFTVPVAGYYQIAAKSISRYIALGKEAEYRCLLADMAGVAAVGSVISALIVLSLKSYVLERLHLKPDVYIYIIAILCVAAWWLPFCLTVYQGRRGYNLMVIHFVITSVLTLVLTVVFIKFTNMGLFGALVAKALPGVITGIMAVILLKPLFSGQRVRDPAEMSLMNEMFIPVNIYLGCLALLSHMAPLFVRNFMVNQSGGYGALSTMGIIPGHIIASVVFVIFPLAAAEHAAGKEVSRFYKQALLIGAVVTLGCSIILAAVAKPLILIWNAAYISYAIYVGPFAFAMGLNGIIQVIASVELARHRYSFLWWMAIPAVTMCCFLYFSRNTLSMSMIMTAMVSTHLFILAAMSVAGLYARGK